MNTVTIIIRSLVHKTHIINYGEYQRSFQKELNLFNGFIELKSDHHKLKSSYDIFEYNLTISFDCYSNLKKWENNNYRVINVLKTKKFVEPKKNQLYWKEALLIILTVYPLIIGTDFLLQFFLPMKTLEPKITLFLNLTIVVFLMQYGLMPLVKTYFSFWLDKNS